MFESRKEKEAAITLCIFPHLKEFIAVDARVRLPDRPVVRVLKFDEVLGGDFTRRIEGDFSKLLRRPDLGFMMLIAMPQELEGLIRAHSLHSVIEALSRDLPEGSDREIGSVGVMFFAGGLLGVSDDQLHEVAKDLFGQHLTPGQVRSLHEQMRSLLKQERDAVAATSKAEMEKLIRGEEGPYVTLWERDAGA
ncbi:MAG: hypothetical protein EXR44_00680 [Dehalococcoidia bacterium]|nr:hypothetical protein [Dehalococcoidia bacterium]